ncbi:hypothetical protein HOE37_03730 [Candidatus Woesearchaeota archaeon]|jgi:hypothetical protein|nr:hypothetical protein [Candidatus Woesearchaeota archaeon]MBT4110941.1 hypothetical protein [Candidatus Woesearchaeota archaeon]MBT4336547.1 hypothetical protein [Candidatus Woesearchaeota archaeon]MBT4469704.1 hypothetical protein [Candidatus Woesearchaeota archaeon]MBT6744066.1 hypothetical protein [Candidatus Woesearchaeota archaeon]
MLNINLIIGTLGMLFILAAFILDEFVRKFNQDTVQYNVLNIIGAFLLIYYAFSLNSLPFIILNVVWLTVAGFKLVRILRSA